MKNFNDTNRNRTRDLPACSSTAVEKTEIVGKTWRQVIAVSEKPESAGDASGSHKLRRGVTGNLT